MATLVERVARVRHEYWLAHGGTAQGGLTWQQLVDCNLAAERGSRWTLSRDITGRVTNLASFPETGIRLSCMCPKAVAGLACWPRGRCICRTSAGRAPLNLAHALSRRTPYVSRETLQELAFGWRPVSPRIYGTFHHVSPAHLHRYAAEFDFRHNHRVKLGYDDDTRALIALKGIEGKRLTYRRTGGAQ